MVGPWRVEETVCFPNSWRVVRSATSTCPAIEDNDDFFPSAALAGEEVDRRNFGELLSDGLRRPSVFFGL